MKKPRGLKVRHYSDHMIGLNKYLSVLNVAKESDTICEMELNEILFYSMNNNCIRQAYVLKFNIKCVQITTLLYLCAVDVVNLFSSKIRSRLSYTQL